MWQAGSARPAHCQVPQIAQPPRISWLLDLIPYARAMHFLLCFCRIIANGRTTEVEIVHPSQGSGPSGYFRPTRCPKLCNPPMFSWVLDLIPYARAMHFLLCFVGFSRTAETPKWKSHTPHRNFASPAISGPAGERWPVNLSNVP